MVHGQIRGPGDRAGHIFTYASLATLLEWGYSHFFHAKYTGEEGNELRGLHLFSGTTRRRGCMHGRTWRAADGRPPEDYRHELRGSGAFGYPHPG